MRWMNAWDRILREKEKERERERELDSLEECFSLKVDGVLMVARIEDQLPRIRGFASSIMQESGGNEEYLADAI